MSENLNTTTGTIDQPSEDVQHTITEQDLVNNPELRGEVEPGDEVALGPSEEAPSEGQESAQEGTADDSQG